MKLISFLPIALLMNLITPNSSPIDLENFKTNQHLQWRIVNDGVMGGISNSQFQILPDHKGLFSGRVSLENNGGFASTRAYLQERLVTDLSVINIKAKGDGQRYSFRVWTDTNFRVSYKIEFDTIKDDWTTYQFSLVDFVPTWRGRILDDVPTIESQNIQEIGFLIADKQAGIFELLIDWIQIE